jgi:N-acetylglucosaminyldiphosphoundecaprenol N-acetyl-beta-D-mannosaminyltransferase
MTAPDMQVFDTPDGPSAISARLAAIRRLRVGGLPIADLDRAETAALTIEAAMARRGAGGPCLFFTTSNGQVVSLCAQDSEVRGLYLQADLISPDGMPLVFASRRFFRKPLRERVATTDAFHDAARIAQERGATFFLFGATEEASIAAVENARRLYPRLNIVGRRNGYFRPEEEADVAAQINEAAPDVLWVGIGVPAQQRFAVRRRAALDRVGVLKTCGGLFDFLSGQSSRAPQWMQSAGMEWAYRAWLEPRRLGWRYLVTNPHALYVLMTQSGPDDGAT